MISYNFPIWKGALDNAPENVTPHNFSIDQNSNGLIQQTKENKKKFFFPNKIIKIIKYNK